MSTTKTIVYQSYRTVNVPGWISRCMATVRSWAAQQGFGYKFVDDSFFEYAPAWYRRKVNNHILLVADLARLVMAKKLLSDGYDRTIWVDADVVVFDPESFVINVTEEYAFCREVWLRRQEVFGIPLPIIRRDEKVNNAVSVFTRNNSMLDFYIHAIESRVKHTPADQIRGGDASTTFLTLLNEQMGLPLLRNVGLFSPLIIHSLATGEEKYVKKYMKQFRDPVYAANIVHSGLNITWMGVEMTEEVYDAAIENLIETMGAVLNRYSVGGG